MSITTNQGDSEDHSPIRVLVVDDNEAFLQVTTDFLTRQPELVIVGTVCGSTEALTQAQNLRPHIIVVGLDGMGLEIITHLRKAFPDVGIIALTLAEGEAYRQAVMDAGADGLVSKTELVTELLLSIRLVMGLIGDVNSIS